MRREFSNHSAEIGVQLCSHAGLELMKSGVFITELRVLTHAQQLLAGGRQTLRSVFTQMQQFVYRIGDVLLRLLCHGSD